MSPLFHPQSQCIQDVLVDNAWSSPTRLADFISKRNAVFTESHLRSQCSIGSNGCCISVLKTRLRSHADTLTVGAGCNCWAPFRKQVIRICDPSDWSFIFTCWAEIPATYTFRVDGTLLLSSRDCRKHNTIGTGEWSGTKLLGVHQSVKSFYL